MIPCDFASALTTCAVGSPGVTLVPLSCFSTATLFQQSRGQLGAGPRAPALHMSRRLGRAPEAETVQPQPQYEARPATEGGTLPGVAELSWLCFSGVRCHVSPMQTQTQTPRFAYERARGAPSIRNAVVLLRTQLCQLGLPRAARSTSYL